MKHICLKNIVLFIELPSLSLLLYYIRMCYSLKGHSALLTFSITMIFHYAESHIMFMIMMNVIMLSVVMLDVVTLNVVAPSQLFNLILLSQGILKGEVSLYQ
jgi:hypothetical protein